MKKVINLLEASGNILLLFLKMEAQCESTPKDGTLSGSQGVLVTPDMMIGMIRREVKLERGLKRKS